MDNDMDTALVELRSAHEALNEASQRTADARRDECTCLNRVNAAQKRLDALVGELKKKAPRESDWYRATLPKQPAIG